MELQSKILDDREKITSEAIKRVSDVIPGVQKKITAEILKFLRTLEIDSQGNVKPSGKNLLAVNKFVNSRVKFTLKSGEYKENAKEFLNTIKSIGSLTKEYFKQEVK